MIDYPEMPSKVLNAYQVYLFTHSLTETAKEVRVSRTTLHKWKKQYKWEERARDHLKKLQKDAEAYRKDIKQEHRKMVRFLIAKGLKKAQNEELVPKSITDFLNLLKYELELEGERFDGTTIEINTSVPLELLHKEIEERRLAVEFLKKKEELEGKNE